MSDSVRSCVQSWSEVSFGPIASEQTTGGVQSC